MRASLLVSILVLSTVTAAVAASQAHTAGDCGQYSWDMTRELGSPKADPLLLLTPDR